MSGELPKWALSNELSPWRMRLRAVLFPSDMLFSMERFTAATEAASSSTRPPETHPSVPRVSDDNNGRVDAAVTAAAVEDDEVDEAGGSSGLAVAQHHSESPFRMVTADDVSRCCKWLSRPSTLIEMIVTAALLAAVVIAAFHDPMDRTCATDYCYRLRVADFIVTLIFAAEIALHAIAFGVMKMLHPARMLDVALVSVNLSMLLAFLCGGAHRVVSVSIVRSLRLLRPAVSSDRFPAVRNLVVAILRCVLELADVAVLLFLFLACMAVAGLNQFGGSFSLRCVSNAAFQPLPPPSLGALVAKEAFNASSSRDASYEHNGSTTVPWFAAYNLTLQDFVCGGAIDLQVLGGAPHDCSPDRACAAPMAASASIPAATASQIGGSYHCPYGFQCATVANPYNGYLGFDNIAQAFMSVFVAVTLQAFPELTNTSKDGVDSTAGVFFVFVVVVGTFLLVNLTVVILTVEVESSHDSQQKRDEIETEAREGGPWTFYRAVQEMVRRAKEERDKSAQNQSNVPTNGMAGSNDCVLLVNTTDLPDAQVSSPPSPAMTDSTTAVPPSTAQTAHSTSRPLLPPAPGDDITSNVDDDSDGGEAVGSDGDSPVLDAARSTGFRGDLATDTPSWARLHWRLGLQEARAAARVLHERCRRTAESSTFATVVAVVVAVNLTLLCTTFYGMPRWLSQAYEVLNVVFTVCYAAEAAVVFFGSASIKLYVLNPLNGLDLFVLVVSVLDIAEAGTVPILRALRTIRAIKLTKMFPSLYEWVMRIAVALQVAPVLLVLLMLTVVLFACLAMQTLGGVLCSVPPGAPLSAGATLLLNRTQTAECGFDHNSSRLLLSGDFDAASSASVNQVLTAHVRCLLGDEAEPAVIDQQSADYFDDPRLDAPYCSSADVLAYSTGPSRLNFNSFSRACITSMVLVFQDQWHHVFYDSISAGGAGYAVPFMLFQYVASFVLLNLLIAVLLTGHDSESVSRQPAEPGAVTHSASTSCERRRRLGSAMNAWELVDISAPFAASDGTTDDGDVLIGPGSAARLLPEQTTGFDRADLTSLFLRVVNRVRGQCRVAVESVPFRVFMTLAILTSSAGIALEDPIGAPDTVRATSLRTLDAVVTAAYFLELLINITAYGLISWTNADTYLRRDPFNVLDFALVIISIVSTAAANLPSVGVVRVLKVMSTIRPLRLVARSPSMKLVFASVTNAARPLRNVAAITLIVTVMYAVIGVFLFGGTLQVCFLPNTILTAANTVALGNGDRYGYYLWPPYANRSNGGRLFQLGDDEAGGTAAAMQRAIATLNIPPSGLLVPFNRDPMTGVEASLNATMCNALGGLYMNNGPHFDNVAAATMSLFQVATLAQWTWVMFRVQSAVAPGVPPTADNTAAAWYVAIFLVAGGLLLFNLSSAALIDAYNRAKRERMALPSMRCAREQDAWLLTEKRILRRLVTHESLVERSARNASVTSAASNASFELHESSRLSEGQTRDEGEDDDADRGAALPKRNNEASTGALAAVRRSIHLNLVLDPRAKHAIMALVALNFVVEATRYFPSGPGSRSAYDGVNIAFTSLFVLEMALKLFAEGRTAFFASRWNRLDFSVTVVCTVAMILQLTANSRVAALVLTFRVIRLAQYTRGALQIESLISKIRRSLVHLLSILAVFCLVFFIFAVMGMKLFGRVQWGRINVGLDANYNFSRVDLAFMLAFRVMLGGEWPSLLYSTVRHGPDYDCSHQLGSCGSSQPVPQLYYAALVTLTGLVLKHLITAVILDSFGSSALNKAETKNNATTFCQLWRQFDPHLAKEISAFDVLRLVRGLPPTSVLCFTRSLSQRSRISQELKFLTELRILDVRAPIPLADVVDVLCRFAFDVDAPSARDCQQTPLPPRLELESLLIELGALDQPAPPSDPSASTGSSPALRGSVASSPRLVASIAAAISRSASSLSPIRRRSTRRRDGVEDGDGSIRIGAAHDGGLIPSALESFAQPPVPPRPVEELKAAAIELSTKNAALLLARSALLKRVRTAKRRLTMPTTRRTVPPAALTYEAVADEVPACACAVAAVPPLRLPAPLSANGRGDGDDAGTVRARVVVGHLRTDAVPIVSSQCASSPHAVVAPPLDEMCHHGVASLPPRPPHASPRRPPGTTTATIIDDLDAVHRALSRPLLQKGSNAESSRGPSRPGSVLHVAAPYVSRSRSPSLHDPADLL